MTIEKCIREFGVNDVIFEEGSTGRELYVVLDGQVEIARMNGASKTVIVTLGKFATQVLLRSRTPISQVRGRWHDYQGVPVMPTFHPAYLLRNPSDKRIVWEDIKQVMARLDLPLPARG